MRSFRQIAIVSLLALAPISAAYGQANQTTTYREVLRQCGAEWKTSEARKGIERGKGMAAWQEFRAKCVKEKGWSGTPRRPVTNQRAA